jgi:hypothetical protein
VEPVRGAAAAEGRLMAHGVDPRLLDILEQASTLQLYQLRTVIGQMLVEPRRVMAIRQALHLGQTVRFVDWQDGSMRTGTVIAMRETDVTVHEEQAKLRWKLPYAAVDPSAVDAENVQATPHRSAPPRQAPAALRRGDKVTFDDQYGNTIAGTVVRVNQKTATVDPGDGTTWRVAFGLLRPLIDV